MPYKYAREKLRQIARTLATEEGDVRARLLIASRNVWRLKPEDLPPALQKDLTKVKADLTRYGPLRDPNGTPWRDAVTNTMKNIRKSTGREIAQTLFDMWRQIERLAALPNQPVERNASQRVGTRAVRASHRRR